MLWRRRDGAEWEVSELLGENDGVVIGHGYPLFRLISVNFKHGVHVNASVHTFMNIQPALCPFIPCCLVQRSSSVLTPF
jgi:hypothetical protein